jgi:putative spermidine/putrescine transport system ATP-binding protein
MKPTTTFVAEFVGTSNVIRGDLARQLSGHPQPFSIRPEHVRFADGPLASNEIEVSGVLHDIQYQGSATRYELTLENGQTLSISHANNQWIDSSAQHQTGQRLRARWAREAMIALHDTVSSGV